MEEGAVLAGKNFFSNFSLMEKRKNISLIRWCKQNLLVTAVFKFPITDFELATSCLTTVKKIFQLMLQNSNFPS
jgi:hypothetical protein